MTEKRVAIASGLRQTIEAVGTLIAVAERQNEDLCDDYLALEKLAKVKLPRTSRRSRGVLHLDYYVKELHKALDGLTACLLSEETVGEVLTEAKGDIDG